MLTTVTRSIQFLFRSVEREYLLYFTHVESKTTWNRGARASNFIPEEQSISRVLAGHLLDIDAIYEGRCRCSFSKRRKRRRRCGPSRMFTLKRADGSTRMLGWLQAVASRIPHILQTLARKSSQGIPYGEIQRVRIAGLVRYHVTRSIIDHLW